MKETIKQILEHNFTSVSKEVFLLMAVVVSVALFIGILSAEQYMTLASMAFGYYFGRNGAKKNDNKVKVEG